jgi:hypothetical protein
MGTIAAPGFSTVWQTGAALVVAFSCWFVSTLFAGVYVIVFQPSCLTLWTLAVAGWCGVFVARKASDFLFGNYAQQAIFFLFLGLSTFNPILGYLTDHSGLEQLGKLAQMLATLATAYTLFLPHDHAFLTDSSAAES